MRLSPFTNLPVPSQKRLLIGMLGLTLLVMVGLRSLDRPLQTATAPFGIVSFEFASDVPTATRMIAEWGAEGKVYAGLSLGFDYLFMVAYSSALALACALIAGRFAFGPLHRTGMALAWLQFVAAGLDAIENVALIQLLLGSQASIWPPLALWSATIKFILLAAGIGYILVAGLRLVLQRRRSAR